MISLGHPEVSVERRCELLGVPRATYYRGLPSGLREGDRELMLQIDKLYLEHLWMGSRSLADQLDTPGAPVGRDRIRRLMRIMGIESLAPKPGTSRRQPRHPVYPYLLRGMTIDRPNQVWATDITYIPMARGHLYLIAIMDWQPARFCPGSCPTPSTPVFASRHLRKHCSRTALRRYSIPTRAASLPARPLPPS